MVTRNHRRAPTMRADNARRTARRRRTRARNTRDAPTTGIFETISGIWHGEILMEKFDLKEGRLLGSILKEIEEQWLKNNFKISNKQIEDIVKSKRI